MEQNSFETMLESPDMKAAFEARLEKERKEWERISSLTQEERLSERESALNARESAVRISEIRAAAREGFVKRGLPAEFAAIFAFNDENDIEGGINAVETAFRSAVQTEILTRLGGQVPSADIPHKPESEMSDEEYYLSIGK